jgi:protein-S-isoprenylcysteine O-methyltransferase Ste14
VDPEPASGETKRPGGFLSARPSRTGLESVFVRLVATAGIVGIGTALGAALGAWTDMGTWMIALVVSLISVVLAAVLWRSREL